MASDNQIIWIVTLVCEDGGRWINKCLPGYPEIIYCSCRDALTERSDRGNNDEIINHSEYEKPKLHDFKVKAGYDMKYCNLLIFFVQIHLTFVLLSLVVLVLAYFICLSKVWTQTLEFHTSKRIPEKIRT